VTPGKQNVLVPLLVVTVIISLLAIISTACRVTDLKLDIKQLEFVPEYKTPHEL
jgi:hypothetical protein